MHRILLIDDDEDLAPPLATYLKRFDLALDSAARPSLGLARLAAQAYDAVILDVMLPEMDGFEVCRRIRHGSDIPVLMLTARGDVTDRVVGLELGADDYLPKPFEPRELLLRINAILRRVPKPLPKAEPPRTLQLGEVRYDMGRGELWRGHDLIRLTATESLLMRILAGRPNEPVTRQELVEDLGGGVPEAQERAVDVQITRLRRKIEDDPRMPRYLQTVRGSGYMLAPD
jgi:two-component system phosphate regulon response regulator OmpR